MRRRKSVENVEFPMSVRVNFGVGNDDVGKRNGAEDEGEEFLKPISVEKLANVIDDDNEDGDYLKPRARASKAVEADGDNDEDEYLKPTFGRFERIDSRDLSPPLEKPPPIPMQSYSPLK